MMSLAMCSDFAEMGRRLESTSSSEWFRNAPRPDCVCCVVCSEAESRLEISKTVNDLFMELQRAMSAVVGWITPFERKKENVAFGDESWLKVAVEGT